MVFRLKKDGVEVNVIESSKEFAEKYAKDHGYDVEPVSPSPEPKTPPTEIEQLRSTEANQDELILDQEYRLTMLELGI